MSALNKPSLVDHPQFYALSNLIQIVYNHAPLMLTYFSIGSMAYLRCISDALDEPTRCLVTSRPQP